jgi:uncharacterized protein YndB with AHSA1/START domain
MTKRSATHATFAIERVYPHDISRVYRAFADPAAKKQWFAPPQEGQPDRHSMDFRVGGREVNSGGMHGGPVYVYTAVYQDIVPDERIVYSYDMTADDVRISVSVATLEFRPDGAGTRLLLTEQGVFLDGHDTPEQRERGTKGLLDMLGRALAS